MGYISSGQSCSRSPFHAIGNIMRETLPIADRQKNKQNSNNNNT